VKLSLPPLAFDYMSGANTWNELFYEFLSTGRKFSVGEVYGE
jgi:hypothetical protein